MWDANCRARHSSTLSQCKITAFHHASRQSHRWCRLGFPIIIYTKREYQTANESFELFQYRLPNAFSDGKIHFEGQFTFPLSSKKTPKDIKTESWSGEVVSVADGDTITVLHDGKGEKMRLYGIDCPEKRQAFGKKAEQFTSEMV